MNKENTEELVRHLGLLYNTVGIVMKDLIKVVGSQFNKDPSQYTDATTVPK